MDPCVGVDEDPKGHRVNTFAILDVRTSGGGMAIVRPSEDSPGEWLAREDGGAWVKLAKRHIRPLPPSGKGLMAGVRSIALPPGVGDGDCLVIFDTTVDPARATEVYNLLTPFQLRIVGY
jgi:hypothetical protein